MSKCSADSHQQDDVEDVQNPLEEEHATAVVICATHAHRPHVRVARHSSVSALSLILSADNKT